MNRLLSIPWAKYLHFLMIAAVIGMVGGVLIYDAFAHSRFVIVSIDESQNLYTTYPLFSNKREFITNTSRFYPVAFDRLYIHCRNNPAEDAPEVETDDFDATGDIAISNTFYYWDWHPFKSNFLVHVGLDFPFGLDVRFHSGCDIHNMGIQIFFPKSQ